MIILSQSAPSSLQTLARKAVGPGFLPGIQFLHGLAILGAEKIIKYFQHDSAEVAKSRKHRLEGPTLVPGLELPASAKEEVLAHEARQREAPGTRNLSLGCLGFGVLRSPA